MMKVKATKKEMRENYRIIKMAYCEGQYLLKYLNPIAYSAGMYGWDCDYYDVDGVVISTGYRPLSNKNVTCDYDLIRKYDDFAREVVENYSLPYETKKEQVTALLKEFVKTCKEEESK